MPTYLSCSVGPYLLKKRKKLKQHFYQDADSISNVLQICFNDAKLPVVKEKLLLWFNVVLGKYSNPVITSNDHDFSITVWVDGMIGKAYLVTLPCGINYII